MSQWLPDAISEIPEALRKNFSEEAAKVGMTLEAYLSMHEEDYCRMEGRRAKIERHFAIQDKQGQVRLMKPLTLGQLKLLAVLEMCEREGVPAWVIVGKSRKRGISSFVAAYALDEYIKRGVDVLVIAHEKSASTYLLGIYQRFLRYLDQQFEKRIYPIPKPELWKGKTNKYEIRLEGKEGYITVDTANNENAGRSRTPQIVHSSETAFWDKGHRTIISLAQAVGRKPGTVFVMESTFNGQDGLFYPTWDRAYGNARVLFEGDRKRLTAKLQVMDRDKWNGWIPVFVGALEDEDAVEPFLDGEDRERFKGTLDEYEQNLMANHGASLEYLNWRRITIKIQCNNDVAKYKQEYPATPLEALASSNACRFSVAKLDSMPVDDGTRGRLETTEDWEKRTVWKVDPQGSLTVFRHPVAGHHYIVACDPVEGSDKEEVIASEEEKLDAAVIDVYDLDYGGEQVAQFREVDIRPEALVKPLFAISRYYNEAFIVPEGNSFGAHICIELEKIYDNGLLYHRDDWDETNTRRNRAVGHKTTMMNRSQIIDMLADAVYHNEILLHSAVSVGEFKSFVKTKKGKFAAAVGKHDDCVMAAALAVAGMRIAKKIFESRERQQRNRQVSYYKRLAGNTGRAALTGY